jgi:hypothetical protein
MSTRPSIKKDLKRLSKWAFWFGIALGLVCNMLPDDYRAACHAVVKACTAGN